MQMSRNFVAAVALLAFFLLATTSAPLGSAQTTAKPTAPTAASDSDPADQGFHVDIAPYLWFPAINGTVAADGYQSSVHVSAGDVLSNFNIGIMGAAEMRYNRLVIPIDFMWVKLEDNKALPVDQDADSVHTKLNEDIFTPKIGYRLVSKPRFKVDTLIGIRYWHFGTTLTLKPTDIAGSHYAATNWVDGVQGARFQALIAPKLWLTVAGDAGGGGARLDYQVVGLLGYQLKRVTLQGGWRYLVVHQDPTQDSFVHAAMTGLVLGVVIPLK